MTRRPVFIVGTEGESVDAMKAAAAQALAEYEAAVDDVLPFLADLDGTEPQRFASLVDAMTWAEGVDGATGRVSCLGVVVLRYESGSVDMAE